MKIIADTATLIPPAEGPDLGMTIIPVCVSIDGRTYQDYSDITTQEFLQLIDQGGVPCSSQPAIGDILEVMESSGEEMLFLTVGDGLSGAYQTTLGARNLAENPERIQIVNSKTLAGPMRYLAKKAVATLYGLLFGLWVCVGYSPLTFFLPLVTFLAVLYLFRIVSLSSMVSAAAAVVYLWLTGAHCSVVIASLLFTALIILRHRENIGRMCRGTENKVRWIR